MGHRGAPVDYHRNEIRNVLAHLLAADPGAPSDGQWWVNTTDWTVKWRLNGVTISLGRLDQISPPTGPVAMNGQKITGAAAGTVAGDVVTFEQFQAALLGLDFKGSVRVVATTNTDIASAPAAIAGVTLANGDRVLLTGQTTGSQNGIYIFNGAAAAMTRATDFDTNADASPGALVPVEEGTDGNSLWFHSTDAPITLGTTALTFINITPQTGYQKVSFNIGDGAATSFNLDHNLGTKDVDVTVFQNSDGAEWEPEITRPTINRVTVAFGVPVPTVDQFRVVIGG